MSRKIDEIRRSIDRIDLEILELLKQRAGETAEIGRVKKESGRTVYDPAREARVVERLLGKNRAVFPEKGLRAVFGEIFSACRALEEPLKIAYLGPEATFTHQAALRTFGAQSEYLARKGVALIFESVAKEQADYGLVPIENSNEGMVSHTLDMFLDSELRIVREVMFPVQHHLLGRCPFESVRHVYSHPQALAQCGRWLEENLAGVTVHEAESTAAAVRKVARLQNSAAIGSEIASLVYGVPVLRREIQDSSRNFTRFLVIGRHYAEKSGRDRTSILFSIRDRVGALHDMLLPFSNHGLNLTRIESRPTRRRAWEYVFFVDFMGYKDDPEAVAALSELENLCLFIKILGSYPAGDDG